VKGAGNDKEQRLSALLRGRLIWATLAASAVLHFGLWGALALPRAGAGENDASRPNSGFKVTVVRVPWDKLPAPPSIEPRAIAARAPIGLSTKGDVGEVPLPVPDAEAEADTFAALGADADGFPGADIRLVVTDPGDVKVAEPDPGAPDFVREYAQPPELIFMARPKFPEIARASGVEGDVVLFVYIDDRGDVVKAVVASSPGLPALEEEAIAAALKCRFRPAEQQGRPVGVWYNLVMEFRR